MSFCRKIIIVIILFGVLAVRQASAAAPTYGPDSITLTVISSSQINLSWSAVTADPAVSGYMIERETPIGGGFTTVTVNTGSTGTTYSDTNLSAGTVYSYRISAVNSDGTGPARPPAGANAVAATTSGGTLYTGPPNPPQNLVTTAVSGSEISLSWTAAQSDSAITGYKIERDWSGGFTTVVNNTNSVGTSYTDTNLSSNVTYTYRVSAYNISGLSNPSIRAHATTPVRPGAPSSASAVGGDGQATVSWSPAYSVSGGVTGYIVSSTPSSSQVSVNSSTFSITIIGLTNGVPYSFAVSGINLAGPGPAITTNVVVPLASLPAVAPTAPPPPPAPEVIITPPPSVQSLQDQLNSLMVILQALTLQAEQQGAAASTGIGQSVAPPVSAQAPEASSNFVFTSILQRGMRGMAVQELQKRLTKEGFYTGPVTGYFGPLTEAALKTYQSAQGISPVGILGPITRASLNKNL